MRARGMSLQAISDVLNAEGVPTLRGGTHWRPSSVQAATGYKRPPAKPADGPTFTRANGSTTRERWDDERPNQPRPGPSPGAGGGRARATRPGAGRARVHHRRVRTYHPCAAYARHGRSVRLGIPPLCPTCGQPAVNVGGHLAATRRAGVRPARGAGVRSDTCESRDS